MKEEASAKDGKERASPVILVLVCACGVCVCVCVSVCLCVCGHSDRWATS